MGLFRFPHAWPAIVPAGSDMEGAVPLLDDRDRELEDHLAYPWQDYTPAIDAVTTDPTMGTDASLTGRYARHGRTVVGWATILFGTAGAAAGTGEYAITLPVAPQGFARVIGSVYLLDNSAPTLRTGVLYLRASTTTAVIVLDAVAGATVTDSVPWTWANNDSIAVNFTYESAE